MSIHFEGCHSGTATYIGSSHNQSTCVMLIHKVGAPSSMPSTFHRPPRIHVQNDAALPQLTLKQAAIWKAHPSRKHRLRSNPHQSPKFLHIKTKRQVLLLQVRVQSESLCT